MSGAIRGDAIAAVIFGLVVVVAAIVTGKLVGMLFGVVAALIGVLGLQRRGSD